MGTDGEVVSVLEARLGLLGDARDGVAQILALDTGRLAAERMARGK